MIGMEECVEALPGEGLSRQACSGILPPGQARESGTAPMLRIQLHGPVAVGGLTQMPSEVLEKLRELLATGVEAEPDEQRPNFFRVRDNGRLYYFYISPVSAKIWLVESHSRGVQAAAHA